MNNSKHSDRRGWIKQATGCSVGLALPMAAVAQDRHDQALAELLARSGSPRCALVPEEMEGPYPLRGLLGTSELVRSDIREGLPGTPLMLRIRLVDTGKRCQPMTGAAVYIWQCDRDGQYSGYDVSMNRGQTGRTYLRGLQTTNSQGEVTFSTLFPGWYRGRITHIHVMVLAPGAQAKPGAPSALTTQLAFPDETVHAVYAQELYPRGANRMRSMAQDPIFRDGAGMQTLTMAGQLPGTLYGAITLGLQPG